MAAPEVKVRRQGLPAEAQEMLPGDQYPADVAPDERIPELTFKAVFVGVVLAMGFGTANACCARASGSRWALPFKLP